MIVGTTRQNEPLREGISEFVGWLPFWVRVRRSFYSDNSFPNYQHRTPGLTKNSLSVPAKEQTGKSAKIVSRDHPLDQPLTLPLLRGISLFRFPRANTCFIFLLVPNLDGIAVPRLHEH